MSYIEKNFKLLYEIGECIAKQFGSSCEVVLHDLTRSYDNTIVAIWNGHVTGRKVGDGGTDAGLELLRNMTTPKDEYCYLNHTSDGKILKSTSKYFLEDGKIVGSLCINQDIGGMIVAKKAIDEMVTDCCIEKKDEIFTGNVEELLETMLKTEVQEYGKAISELNKEEKISIVHRLDKKGAFLIKKAPERVAELLGTSRFTIYNYLNAQEKKEEE